MTAKQMQMCFLHFSVPLIMILDPNVVTRWYVYIYSILSFGNLKLELKPAEACILMIFLTDLTFGIISVDIIGLLGSAGRGRLTQRPSEIKRNERT